MFNNAECRVKGQSSEVKHVSVNMFLSMRISMTDKWVGLVLRNPIASQKWRLSVTTSSGVLLLKTLKCSTIWIMLKLFKSRKDTSLSKKPTEDTP